MKLYLEHEGQLFLVEKEIETCDFDIMLTQNWLIEEIRSEICRIKKQSDKFWEQEWQK